MISSMVAPDSRFSNTVATGMRVSLNTHAPLTLPGMLSTAGHCDQSRVAMFLPPFHRKLFATVRGGVTRKEKTRHVADSSVLIPGDRFSMSHDPGLRG